MGQKKLKSLRRFNGHLDVVTRSQAIIRPETDLVISVCLKMVLEEVASVAVVASVVVLCLAKCFQDFVRLWVFQL